MNQIKIDKVLKGMLYPCLLILLILSYQTNTNAVAALISVYGFMICLVGYIIIDFFNSNANNSYLTLSFLDKFIKITPIVLIVSIMIGMILNLSINFGKITDNHMPNSYYTFSTLINLFLAIQIIIVVSNLMSNGGNIYSLSDKYAMISIFFGQLGLIMFAILVSITIYNYTQG